MPVDIGLFDRLVADWAMHHWERSYKRGVAGFDTRDQVKQAMFVITEPTRELGDATGPLFPR